MTNRYDALFQRQVDSALLSEGHLDPAIRRAAFEGAEVPAPLLAYVTKVRDHAYKVTDEDVAAMKAAGYSEDQIFEVTVATALGAANVRRERGLAALRAAR